MNTQGPAVFLSASIPDRPPFNADSKPTEIREAVLAIVVACKDSNCLLVFGGHPAISPLVHHAALSLGMINDVYIYQSKAYEDRMPEAAKTFPNLIWTPAQPDERGSQRVLQDRMIREDNWKYHRAFYVGGMEGVLDEFERFGAAHRGIPRFPIASTGGAASELFSRMNRSDLEPVLYQALVENRNQPAKVSYRTLLRSLMP